MQRACAVAPARPCMPPCLPCRRPQDDGDQRPLRGYLPGSPAQTMRDRQSEFGLKMHSPAALASLPSDAFRHAFLGNEADFRCGGSTHRLHGEWPVQRRPWACTRRPHGCALPALTPCRGRAAAPAQGLLRARQGPHPARLGAAPAPHLGRCVGCGAWAPGAGWDPRSARAPVCCPGPATLHAQHPLRAGAQRIRSAQGAGSGHAAILRAVCEAGARVDAVDVAGYTALAHAAGHHPQLDLARVLLEFGADPSRPTRCRGGGWRRQPRTWSSRLPARTTLHAPAVTACRLGPRPCRLGCVPLQHALMAQELEAVQLLLE